jgi:glycosyltransferase involved in cell wall biosynthesis
VLTIAGSGGHPRMPAYLQKIAMECGVQMELKIGVDDCELIRLYRSSAAFVFGARQEPFGLVALEAMACGLPVVAVAEGGVPEIVRDGETGYLAPRDERAFARSLETVLASEEHAGALGRAGRADVLDRWTWQQAGERLEQALEGMRDSSR